MVTRTSLARRDARLAARLFDGSAVALFVAPALGLLVLRTLIGTREGALEVVSPLAVLGILVWVVWNWVGVARRGQSIGKRACGIRITTKDGRPPGFFRGVVVREGSIVLLSAMWESWQPGGGFAAYALNWAALLLPGSRCLHDWLAGTRVVEGSPDPKSGPPPGAGKAPPRPTTFPAESGSSAASARGADHAHAAAQPGACRGDGPAVAPPARARGAPAWVRRRTEDKPMATGQAFA